MLKNKKYKTALLVFFSLILILVNIIIAVTYKNQPSKDAFAPISSENQMKTNENDEVLQSNQMKINLSGDVLLHASVFNAAKTGEGTYNFTPFFSLAKDLFDGDLNILNMEGPVDARGENKNIQTYPTFNAPIEILDSLKEIGITTLITANNHSLDMSKNGLVNTRRNIIDKEFDAIGTYETQEDSDTPFIKEINGIKVGIAAFTDSTNGIQIKDGNYFLKRFVLSESAIPDLTKEVQKLHQAGAEYTIVSLHWGAEYADKPTKTQEKIAQALADAGVDLIMGNHSHCVQPIKKITTELNGKSKECVIIYSLGNFFVNQTGLNTPKTQYGMVVSLNVSKENDGTIKLLNLDYTPTFMLYNKSEKGENAFRVFAAEKYMESDENSKKAYDHVKKIVGEI